MSVAADAVSISQPSCCARMTQCLCSERTKTAVQVVLLVAVFFASPWIPAPAPVNGMLMGGSVMLLVYKASLHPDSLCSIKQWPPRSYKQIIGGTSIFAGCTAAANCVPIVWILPIFFGGTALALEVMFDDRLWWLCEQLKNRVFHIHPDQYRELADHEAQPMMNPLRKP